MSWGLTGAAPEGTAAIWGARLIVDQRGTVDMLPDRQGPGTGVDSHSDVYGELLDLLNAGPLREALAGLKEALRSYAIRTDVQDGWTLYEDEQVIVQADTNASYGYCYVGAWLKASVPTPA